MLFSNLEGATQYDKMVVKVLIGRMIKCAENTLSCEMLRILLFET